MQLPEDYLLKQLKTLEKSLKLTSRSSGRQASAKRGPKHTSATDVARRAKDLQDGINRLIQTTSQRRKRTINQLVLITEAGGKCARCNDIFHPFIYDFHHIDPRTKAFNLDRSVFGRRLGALREEAAKCVLLCATCHREVHVFLDTRFLVLEGVEASFEETVYESRKIGF